MVGTGSDNTLPRKVAYRELYRTRKINWMCRKGEELLSCFGAGEQSAERACGLGQVRLPGAVTESSDRSLNISASVNGDNLI